jgi:hypothetical protein
MCCGVARAWCRFKARKAAHLSGFDHISCNAPVLIRTPKLKRLEPAQYWGGGPPGNSVVLNPFLPFPGRGLQRAAGSRGGGGRGGRESSFCDHFPLNRSGVQFFVTTSLSTALGPHQNLFCPQVLIINTSHNLAFRSSRSARKFTLFC